LTQLKLFTWQKTFLFFLSGFIFPRFPVYSLFIFLFLFFFFESKKYFYAFFYCLGIAYFYLTIPANYYPFALDFFKKKIEVKGIVSSIEFLPENKKRILLDEVYFNNIKIKNKLMITLEDNKGKDRDILPGDKIEEKLKVKPVAGLKDKGVFGYSFFGTSKNIFYRSYAKSLRILDYKECNLIYKFKRYLYQKIYFLKANVLSYLNEISAREETKAVILALLLNDKSLFTYKFLNFFRETGLGHTLALSGLHLSIVFALGFFLVYGLYFIFPYGALIVPRKKMSIFISFFLSLFYLLLTRAPLSLLRSEIMFLSWGILYLLNKERLFIDGFFIALFLLVLFLPASVFDISFQFSFLAVLGVYFSVYLLKSLKVKNKLFSSILFIFFSTLIINLILLPLQVYYFNQVYTLSFLNIIWIPILSFITLPSGLLFLLFLKYQNIALFFLKIMSISLDFLFSILSSLERILTTITVLVPRPDGWIILSFYLLFLFVILKNKKVIYFLIFSLVLFFVQIIYEDKGNMVSVLDIGQGQSLFLNIDKNRILIDGGGSFNFDYDLGKLVLSKILTYKKYPGLDMIFLTHPDIDHLRGLYYILDRFKFKKFYFNGDLPLGLRDRLILEKILSKNRDKVGIVKRGDRIDLSKDSYLEVLHPKIRGNNSNNDSLVLRLVDRGVKRVLICGDIEKAGLNDLVSSNLDLRAQVLILPHHGSKNSFNEKFYTQVNPQLVIVSSGFLNPYRLPSGKVVNYFQQRNIPLLNTALLGEIDIYWKDKEKFYLTTQEKIVSKNNGFWVKN